MALKPSKVHSHFYGRDVRSLDLTSADVTDTIAGELSAIGIQLPPGTIRLMMAEMASAAGMDAAPDLQPLVGVAALGAPIQFLQAWLPGFVHVLTAARKMDTIVGITTVGGWEDEEIIQGVMEPTGLPQPYGDYNVIPLASWNVNYERRSIVRFEQGMEVGLLEEARTAKMMVDTSSQKRNGAALALDILRNRVGFYGFDAGAGRTYGFLNDPNEPAYVNVAAGAGGLPWSTKTFKEITADIREATATLEANTQNTFDPATGASTLVLAGSVNQYLTVMTDFGKSVKAWITETYPNMRIVSAPELNAANGGANVFYLFADRMDDGVSDDGGATWVQMVPAKFRTLGAEKHIKTYVEDYSNALAGVMLKRPYAVVRRSGI